MININEIVRDLTDSCREEDILNLLQKNISGSQIVLDRQISKSAGIRFFTENRDLSITAFRLDDIFRFVISGNKCRIPLQIPHPLVKEAVIKNNTEKYYFLDLYPAENLKINEVITCLESATGCRIDIAIPASNSRKRIIERQSGIHDVLADSGIKITGQDTEKESVCFCFNDMFNREHEATARKEEKIYIFETVLLKSADTQSLLDPINVTQKKCVDIFLNMLNIRHGFIFEFDRTKGSIIIRGMIPAAQAGLFHGVQYVVRGLRTLYNRYHLCIYGLLDRKNSEKIVELYERYLFTAL
jgi:hypothetical protein